MASWRGSTDLAATSWPPYTSNPECGSATSPCAISPASRPPRSFASSSPISTRAAGAPPPISRDSHVTDSDEPKPLSPATLVIHGGTPARDTDAPVVRPLFQSVNFIQEVGSGDGLRYPRYGNMPNAQVVQERMAALEGSEDAVLLSSGMGAIACALIALLRPGDHLVSSSTVYGGVTQLLAKEFDAIGIAVTFIDPFETRVWRKRLRKTTRAIFIETPVNPTCRVLDLRPVVHLTKELGIALVVDSTFASPINFRPIEHGADVVVH